MKPLRIALAHQTVVRGDAVGNDITGAYGLFERYGFVPTILCEFPSPDIASTHRVDRNLTPAAVAQNYDVLLYHHSTHWPSGEALLQAFDGTIMCKYHNITPPEFFAPYSDAYEQECRSGREQTARLASLDRILMWQTDSAYNAAELMTLGITDQRITVVPPMNRVGELWNRKNLADYDNTAPRIWLFVGRRAPNKGHRHLLRTLGSYLDLFSADVKLVVVGAVDQRLSAYTDELLELTVHLGLERHVEWRGHVEDREIDALFLRSHVYVHSSEHEGFCVPVVEAQAVGLPVVTVDATALRETMGSGQLVLPIPHEDDDYDLFAGLIHEVCTNPTLRDAVRRTGFRNVWTRFTDDEIEVKFAASLIPALQRAA